MAIVKNMLVIFVCFLMLAACDLNEKTTFEVLFPVEETRNVDLEFRNERATLEFVLGDSLRKSVITIPVSGEQYVPVCGSAICHMLFGWKRGNLGLPGSREINGILRGKEQM